MGKGGYTNQKINSIEFNGTWLYIHISIHTNIYLNIFESWKQHWDSYVQEHVVHKKQHVHRCLTDGLCCHI